MVGLRKRRGRVEVDTVAAVVAEVPLMDRAMGRSGERTGNSGGDAGGEEGVASASKESMLKPEGGLTMPTRRERGKSVEGRCEVISTATPADDISELISEICAEERRERPQNLQVLPLRFKLWMRVRRDSTRPDPEDQFQVQGQVEPEY